MKVTYAADLNLESPVRIAGDIVLETGSEVLWFTFPGAWHDIGTFHRAAGSFVGTYANILTPCVFEDSGVWHTTDLFLDIWIDSSGTVLTLDEEELDEAEAGSWPPAVVGEWTLERARVG